MKLKQELKEVKEKWKELSEYKRMFIWICFINLLIYSLLSFLTVEKGTVPTIRKEDLLMSIYSIIVSIFSLLIAFYYFSVVNKDIIIRIIMKLFMIFAVVFVAINLYNSGKFNTYSFVTIILSFSIFSFIMILSSSPFVILGIVMNVLLLFLLAYIKDITILAIFSKDNYFSRFIIFIMILTYAQLLVQTLIIIKMEPKIKLAIAIIAYLIIIIFSIWIYANVYFGINHHGKEGNILVFSSEMINSGTQHETNRKVEDMSDFIYFSSTTLFTVGYGDIIPRGNNLKFLVQSQMFIGHFVSVFFIGLLISNLSEKSERKSISNVDTNT